MSCRVPNAAIHPPDKGAADPTARTRVHLFSILSVREFPRTIRTVDVIRLKWPIKVPVRATQLKPILESEAQARESM